MKSFKVKKIMSMVLTVLVCLSLIIVAFRVSPFQLSSLQLETLKILLIICGVSALYCFVVGEITRNNSQMDKLWSILPIIYMWIIAIKGGWSLRLVIMALLGTAWGVRLTLNFAKKGAYKLRFWEGEEDYRWCIIRSNPIFKSKVLWALFDLGFISIYQNLLVLLICLPALAVMEVTTLSAWDILPTLFVAFFIYIEYIADKEQSQFYDKRKALMADGTPLAQIEAPYNKGFNTLGLWQYSRHPNYWAEQSIWLGLYLFTISAGVCVYGVFNWSLVGSLALILLFLGSSTMTESISSSKYPAYALYQQTTSKYIPWFKKNDKNKKI